jgi:hypothetical protein
MRGFSEIDQVGRSRHHHHAHAVHMHPVHWLEGHPLIIAFVLACAITLGIIALASIVDTGIRPEVLDSKYPAVHPYGPRY